MKLIVDDLAVNYRDKGRGRTILLLHGWKSAQEVFSNLSAELAKDYRVISLDLPGFGGSEVPTLDWGIDEYADFLQQFLSKLKLQHLYAVIAHSMSAGIAVKAVVQHKLKPQKVILMGAAGIRHPKSFRNQLLKLVAKTGKVGLMVLPLSHREKLRQRFYKKIGSDYGNAGRLTQTFVRIVGEDVRPYAKKLKLPVLLLYGAQDTETPPVFGKLFQPLITNSKLVVVPGAGHYVFVDQQEATQKVITEFLK